MLNQKKLQNHNNNHPIVMDGLKDLMRVLKHLSNCKNKIAALLSWQVSWVFGSVCIQNIKLTSHIGLPHLSNVNNQNIHHTKSVSIE